MAQTAKEQKSRVEKQLKHVHVASTGYLGCYLIAWDSYTSNQGGSLKTKLENRHISKFLGTQKFLTRNFLKNWF